MNHLQEFLNTAIPRIEQYNQQHPKQIQSVGDILERKVISHSMIRGIGTTTEVKELFNPSTDLYVGCNITIAKEFGKTTGGYHFAITCPSIDSLKGKPGITDITRVFIDVGAGASICPSISKMIYRTIRLLYNKVNPNCIFIIV